MTTLDKLIAQFEQFPGVGARQARRFAFHILTMRPEEVDSLSDHITALRNSMSVCTRCYRYFTNGAQATDLCAVCADSSRDSSRLLVVERDSDIQSIERAGNYDGYYFVLGGTVPLLEETTSARVRGSALKERVESAVSEGLREIILAFSVNPEGENTERYIQSLLTDLVTTNELTVSHLGRGLSTGSELEYADPETLKYALKNRF